MNRRTFLKSLCAAAIAPMLVGVKSVRAMLPAVKRLPKLPDVVAYENLTSGMPSFEKSGCIGNINGRAFVLRSISGSKDGSFWRVRYQFEAAPKPFRAKLKVNDSPDYKVVTFNPYRRVDFTDELRDAKIIPQFVHATYYY